MLLRQKDHNSIRQGKHPVKQASHLTAITLVLAITLAACGSAPPKSIPAVTPSQAMAVPADLRDFRYCEIIPVFRERATLPVEVYNTISLNDCPADLWAKLDAEAMAKQYSAEVVKLNGPRYWVLNQLVGAGATTEGKVVDFGGIEMRLVAQLETKLWEGSVGDAFYVPNEVQRTTTYTYLAGNMVYELTSPEGQIYRMQSYAQIADPKLTIADLEILGPRMKLPQGWSYQARVLTENSQLKADGMAYVINDEFYNSYQRVTP
jgi:hypothetical protein